MTIIESVLRKEIELYGKILKEMEFEINRLRGVVQEMGQRLKQFEVEGGLARGGVSKNSPIDLEAASEAGYHNDDI